MESDAHNGGEVRRGAAPAEPRTVPPAEPRGATTLDDDLDAALDEVRALAATDGASQAAIARFREVAWEHHARAGRPMPWRETADPYRILVSEVMLQQTQVDRVRPKYEAFLAAFPDVETLARAPFEQVLRLWKGLGYNRRALALHRAAGEIVERHGGAIPEDEESLLALSGVGPSTAAGVRAFAFGHAGVYLETNVRAAALHAFFPGRDGVRDAEVREVVRAAADEEDPRAWYYALMDLGAAIKRTHPNPSRRSAHHARQSRFEGSDRQVRGRALEELLDGPLPESALAERLERALGADGDRVAGIVAALVREGLLARDGDVVRIA